MRADIEKDNFVILNAKYQNNATGIGEANGMFVAMLAFKAVQPQTRMFRIVFEL